MLKKVMNRLLPKRSFLMFLKTRHWGHTQIESLISLLLINQKKLYEKVIHNSIGRVLPMSHEIGGSLRLMIRRDDVDKCLHPIATVDGGNHRRRPYVFHVKST